MVSEKNFEHFVNHCEQKITFSSCLSISVPWQPVCNRLTDLCLYTEHEYFPLKKAKLIHIWKNRFALLIHILLLLLLSSSIKMTGFRIRSWFKDHNHLNWLPKILEYFKTYVKHLLRKLKTITFFFYKSPYCAFVM